jgi:hypothetical protein
MQQTCLDRDVFLVTALSGMPDNFVWQNTVCSRGVSRLSSIGAEAFERGFRDHCSGEEDTEPVPEFQGRPQCVGDIQVAGSFSGHSDSFFVVIGLDISDSRRAGNVSLN